MHVFIQFDISTPCQNKRTRAQSPPPLTPSCSSPYSWSQTTISLWDRATAAPNRMEWSAPIRNVNYSRLTLTRSQWKLSVWKKSLTKCGCGSMNRQQRAEPLLLGLGTLLLAHTQHLALTSPPAVPESRQKISSLRVPTLTLEHAPSWHLKWLQSIIQTEIILSVCSLGEMILQNYFLEQFYKSSSFASPSSWATPCPELTQPHDSLAPWIPTTPSWQVGL